MNQLLPWSFLILKAIWLRISVHWRVLDALCFDFGVYSSIMSFLQLLVYILSIPGPEASC